MNGLRDLPAKRMVVGEVILAGKLIIDGVVQLLRKNKLVMKKVCMLLLLLSI